MAQLKYLENGVWVAADTIPQSSDTNPGLIRVYNGLDQVETGFALDASQGKILQDQIDILDNRMLTNEERNTWRFTNPDTASNGTYIIVKLPAKYWLTSMFSFTANFYGGYRNAFVLINAYWYNNASDKIYNPAAVKLGGSGGGNCVVRFGYVNAEYMYVSFAFDGNVYGKGICISNLVKAYNHRADVYQEDLFEIYTATSHPGTIEHTVTLAL